jgi:hypothetical protein
MQVHHIHAAGILMEAVDVLGDQPRQESPAFQSRDGGMAGIGISTPEMGPADVVPGPIPLTVRLIPYELLVRHRRPRRRIGPSVVGDPGIRAQSRPRKESQAQPGQQVPDPRQDFKL